MLISMGWKEIWEMPYWYNRASKPVKRDENLEKEWEELVEIFLTQSGVVNG